MIVYVVMVSDRHVDPEAFLFSTAAAAIQYARQTAHENAIYPDDIEETEIEGWLYHATYSVEDDAVWVLKKAVDDPTGATIGAT